MTTVIFQDRGFDYAVRFRFDPTVVDLLKTAVPSYARSWNPSERMWTVDADWARPLAGILRSAGHTVTGLQPPKPPPTRNGHGDADWAKTLFRRSGPAAPTSCTACCPKHCTPMSAVHTDSCKS